MFDTHIYLEMRVRYKFGGKNCSQAQWYKTWENYEYPNEKNARTEILEKAIELLKLVKY